MTSVEYGSRAEEAVLEVPGSEVVRFGHFGS